MATYNSGDINKENKPKLTPIKAITKFMISYDIKLNGDQPPIFYAWEPKKQPKWIQTENGLYPETEYFTVDYDKHKREWYIGFIVDVENRFFATIDDLTGRCDMTT